VARLGGSARRGAGGRPALLAKLSTAAPNNLGSNVLSQRAAMAGLRSKDEWFPKVQETQRKNQATIKAVVDKLPGFHLPVYPSSGNFLVVECIDAGLQPEAIVAEMQRHNIMVRQGSYHTARFGHRFIKVSTTVPAEWVAEFCDLLPDVARRVRVEGECRAILAQRLRFHLARWDCARRGRSSVTSKSRHEPIMCWSSSSDNFRASRRWTSKAICSCSISARDHAAFGMSTKNRARKIRTLSDW